MAHDDPFANAITSAEQVRALYKQVDPRAIRKQIDVLDEMARRLIALAPLVVVASYDAQGGCDVTPRGGEPGFVTVLDDEHLAIPDATGNNRLDTLVNVVETGHLGLLFLIPGRGQTLRVNGAACVSADPALLERLTSVGKPPRSALVVRVEEVFNHCPKAFVRSRVWDPESWPSADEQPTVAEVAHAHMSRNDAGYSLAEVERLAEESLKSRLA
jgi:uncharacterized protein